MAGIEDVARRCGVSIATVSRVFNRRGNVHEKTRAKVVAAARSLGYRPKLTARRDCVALAVEDLDQVRFGGYNAMLVSALTREVIENGYHLEIVRAVDLAVLRDKFVCGVVSLLYRRESLSLLGQARHLPIVTVNEVVDGLPAVISDDMQGMRSLVNHLVELRHTTIGLRASGRETFNRNRRLDAFRSAVEAAGLDPARCVIDSDRGNMTERLAKLLRSAPTAVIVCGEGSGVSAAHSLDLLGHRVPEDLSLASFEYAGISEYLVPPQTTIAQDFDALAAHAVRMVKEMESDGTRVNAHTHIEVDYTLQVRESTAPPRSSPRAVTGSAR